VSGVRFQGEAVTPNDSKLCSLILSQHKVAMLHGSTTEFPHPYMKLRLAGTEKRLNVEHRTSNIDDATLYLILKQANRIISKGSFAPGLRSLFGGVGLLNLFYKIDPIHYSMLDVQCSMFDVHFLVNPSYETIQEQRFF
jgi:hypothetical protein